MIIVDILHIKDEKVHAFKRALRCLISNSIQTMHVQWMVQVDKLPWFGLKNDNGRVVQTLHHIRMLNIRILPYVF